MLLAQLVQSLIVLQLLQLLLVMYLIQLLLNVIESLLSRNGIGLAVLLQLVQLPLHLI